MSGPAYPVLLASLALIISAASLTQAPSRVVQVAVLVVVGLGAVALYLLACAIWPYANCTRCHGSGKSGAPSRKAFRNCPSCKGTGRRTRIGRRLLDRHNDRHSNR